MKKKVLPERGYKVFKFLLGWVFKLWYRPKIYGKENIPKDGSIVVAANHVHLFDQFGPILATKRVIHYMAKKEYFDSKNAWFFKMSGCISVDRSQKDEAASKTALEVLNNGGAIGIFPEGTRNKTEEFMLPFKFGPVSMANKTDSYLVPVGITGEYKFRSKNLRYYIGKPFKVGSMTLEEANKKLFDEIVKLRKMGMKETNSKK